MPASGGFRKIAEGLVCVQVDTGFTSHCSQALFLQRFDSFRRQTQAHKPLTLFPPNTLVLQVGLLHFLGTTMGVRDREGVVSLFVGEIAMARHDFRRSS